MQSLSRRDFIHAGCTVVSASLIPHFLDHAEAGINNPGSASGGGVVAPFGRVVLNMNEPNYYNNLYPWLNLWKNSEALISFTNGGGTTLYGTSTPAGGISGVTQSAYGVCCDNNGEPIDMTGTGVTGFSKIFYQNSAQLPLQLAGVSYTLMWSGGIGWTGSVQGNATGSLGSKTATTSSTSVAITLPAGVTASTLFYIQFSLNTGSLASPPTGIAFVPTSQVANYLAGAIFDTNWFAQTKSVGGILRCMPIQSTVANATSTSIDSIPTQANFDWSIGAAGMNRGCPLSILSALAIQANKHIWLNIPQGFISPKLKSFQNDVTDITLGAITSANPAVVNFNSNQPWVNGDRLVCTLLNVNNAGAFGRAVRCTDLASSIFTLASHNFVQGQVVFPGCVFSASGDSNTYPTGFSKGTAYFVTNVTASTFQIASSLANALAGTALTLTGTMKGAVTLFGAITGGSSYTNGTYTGVPMTGGTGTSCTATVIVAGGVVTSVIVNAGGTTFTKGDSLSALAANIGGTGSGFSVLVGCVAINVVQNLTNASFTAASAATKQFSLSGPGSDTSVYGRPFGKPTISGSIITSTDSDFANGRIVIFGVFDGVQQDQATYPTGITKGTPYYIVNQSGLTFQISATFGGSPITLSGSSVGTLNAYMQTNVTSGIVQSLFDPAYTYTQVRRFANFFNTAFAGTPIRAYYEYSNEIWNPGGGQQTYGLMQGQGPAYLAIANSNDQMCGYVQATIANAIYDEYSGNRMRYRMLLGDFQTADVGGGTHFNNCLVGIGLWQTATGSTRTIQNLFDHIIVTNYWSQSYNSNGGSVAPVFNTGTSTVAFAGAVLGSPYKFHATAGALPSPLAENTTYWLVGTSPNFGVATAPKGSPVTLSGTLGTYTGYHCGADVIGELMNQSIALNISTPGTWPTKYSYYETQLRQDVNDASWTGGGGIFVGQPGYDSFQWTATAIYPVIIANFLAVGKPCAGLTLLPYEGGDDNSPQGGWWGLTTSSVITASITGTTLTVTAGTNPNIGADITGPGVTAGTLVTGVRTDLGAGNYTVNNSQTSSPTGWASATWQDFYLTTMYSDTYAQSFVDFYNLVSNQYLSGYLSQFLDVNLVGVQQNQGTYGMARYIGDNNPRVTYVAQVNNTP